MAIKAVVTGVEFAILKPANVEVRSIPGNLTGSFWKLPQSRRSVQPELIGGIRLLVNPLIVSGFSPTRACGCRRDGILDVAPGNGLSSIVLITASGT
jgi:hypothetical protein